MKFLWWPPTSEMGHERHFSSTPAMSLMPPTTEVVDALRRDAEMQLNISGSNFVIYVFALDDNLVPTELKRTSYPARD